MNSCDASVARGHDLMLHLHGFQDDERVPLADFVAGRYGDLENDAGHRRRHRMLAVAAPGPSRFPDDRRVGLAVESELQTVGRRQKRYVVQPTVNEQLGTPVTQGDHFDRIEPLSGAKGPGGLFFLDGNRLEAIADRYALLAHRFAE